MTAPLVFLPGWALGAGPLAPTAAALGGSVLDLPGYGDAPPAPEFAAAADTLADRLAPATTLVGWSLGALLATAIAARHPGRVGRLVLIAGTASFVHREGWPHAMPPAVLAEFTAAVAADPVAVLPRFVGSFNRGDARAKAVTRALLESHDPLPDTATLASGLAWLANADLRPLTPHVAAPTLLLHGAADPLMPLAAAEALATLIPGARLEILADGAHAPFLSAPEWFLDQLAAFHHEPPA